MSGVGKGVAVSSIAKILQSRGFNVTAVKIDPYVNVDAGIGEPRHLDAIALHDLPLRDLRLQLRDIRLRNPGRVRPAHHALLSR